MASRRRRRNPAGEDGAALHSGGPLRWMISYADFMTLLFVVFMVLFSMTNVDAAKYRGLAASLRQTMGQSGGAFGPDVTPLPTRGQVGQAMPVVPPEDAGTLPGAPDWPAHLIDEESPADRTPPPAEAPPEDAVPADEGTTPSYAETPPVQSAPPDPMEELAESFQNLPGAATGILAATLEERGLTISIAGSVLFAPGQAALRPEAREYLATVARKLEGVELPILVEGTADQATGANPEGYNPWELAALRAAAVVNYFVQDWGFPGSRFVTIGYGSADGSARLPEMVNIVVLREAE